MNAREEFLKFIANIPIKCASITHGDASWYEDTKEYNLKMNHTEEDMAVFLDSLNFDYDSGYGGQELFGTIWFIDGTWADRGEYDGSEWWQRHVCPEIPEKCH